jgi:poly(A) polymerase
VTETVVLGDQNFGDPVDLRRGPSGGGSGTARAENGHLAQLPGGRLQPGVDRELFEQSVTEALERQLRQVAIPKRFALPMREIWAMQPRFDTRSEKKATRLFSHPRFRAAYDFLLLRAEAGLADRDLAEWWRAFTTESADAPPPTPARRRRRGGRRRGGGSPAPERAGSD